MSGGTTTPDPYLMGTSETEPQTNWSDDPDVDEFKDTATGTDTPTSTSTGTDTSTDETPVRATPTDDEILNALDPDSVEGALAAAFGFGTEEPVDTETGDTPPADASDAGSIESEKTGDDGTAAASSVPPGGEVGGQPTPQPATPQSPTPQSPDLESVFSLAHSIASLAPEQRWQLNQLLTPQSPQQAQVPQQQVPQQEQSAPQPQPADDPFADLAELEPELAETLRRTVNPLREQINSLTQVAMAERQAREQQQRAAIESAVSEAAQAWRESHPYLTEEEVFALESRVGQAAIFPNMMRLHGDPQAAYNAAMEQFFWVDPQLRSRAFDHEHTAAQESAREQAARQRRASSLSSTGAAPPRDPNSPDSNSPDTRPTAASTTPRGPLTPEDRTNNNDRFVAELAELLSQ